MPIKSEFKEEIKQETDAPPLGRMLGLPAIPVLYGYTVPVCMGRDPYCRGICVGDPRDGWRDGRYCITGQVETAVYSMIRVIRVPD
jgi:hypothetical protein